MPSPLAEPSAYFLGPPTKMMKSSLASIFWNCALLKPEWLWRCQAKKRCHSQFLKPGMLILTSIRLGCRFFLASPRPLPLAGKKLITLYRSYD